MCIVEHARCRRDGTLRSSVLMALLLQSRSPDGT
jgi:hypothetical protein